MANTKAKRHVHKYARMDTPMGKIWRCMLPDCTHHIPKHQVFMIEGRYSECWGCGNTMILNPPQLEMDKPTCDECNGVASDFGGISPGLLEIMKAKGLM